MRQLILAFIIIVFALFGNPGWAQAGAPSQAAPAAQPGQSTAQQKQDESECMKWAKQQAGLDQSSSPQQPSSTGTDDKTAADKSAATKPPDNSSQSNATSGVAGAASGMAGSLGGAANSKVAQLVKDAYANCMQKKGYKTK